MEKQGNFHLVICLCLFLVFCCSGLDGTDSMAEAILVLDDEVPLILLNTFLAAAAGIVSLFTLLGTTE